MTESKHKLTPSEDIITWSKTIEKKKWIEPQISAWEYVNLGLNINIGGADGGSKTSAD
ncbi:hypothetical protein [Aquirufa nivalisilvae]|uniref:hypothetical protein n=1 Tax=Aquirufa nivalisilvae TaxID=2516557 RepID=UPI00137562AB|nr:hypothetical protein [Aquirufa nivalisilvae]